MTTHHSCGNQDTVLANFLKETAEHAYDPTTGYCAKPGTRINSWTVFHNADVTVMYGDRGDYAFRRPLSFFRGGVSPRYAAGKLFSSGSADIECHGCIHEYFKIDVPTVAEAIEYCDDDIDVYMWQQPLTSGFLWAVNALVWSADHAQ